MERMEAEAAGGGFSLDMLTDMPVSPREEKYLAKMADMEKSRAQHFAKFTDFFERTTVAEEYGGKPGFKGFPGRWIRCVSLGVHPFFS